MSQQAFCVDMPGAGRLPFQTMLVISLARLEREGTFEFRADISPEDPAWEGTELRFSSPLRASGEARWVPSGEVLVRLSLRGELSCRCRRCLEPVQVPVSEELELLYVPPDEAQEPDEEDEEVRVLDPGATEIDLVSAIREEMILARSPWVLCDPGCRGLCPRCGIDLNEETCQCTAKEPDPRWDALRALKDERD